MQMMSVPSQGKLRVANYVLSAMLFLTLGIGLVFVTSLWTRTILWTAPSPLYLGLAPWTLSFDPLAAFFLFVLAIVGMAAALFSPGYLKHLEHKINIPVYWTCLFLFVFSMAQVILAANAITFLLFWEVMALSSAALVLTDSNTHKAQSAGLIYLAATRLSTAFLSAAFVVFYYKFHSWNFTSWQIGAAHTWLPMLLLFIGLAIKAGVWPFHIWLPYAHPEAPAPVSALMSGVMVKVAIYAMIRFLLYGGSEWVGYLALTLGAISAVWGVLFALMQRDIKRLLAYSTVENIGLVLIALAVTVLTKKSGLTIISALAFSAALMHVLNHALFKSLLFLGAGAIDAQAHTRDLSLLGGLAKKMPLTMALFFVGCLAICAMPPLNGFASKWLIYQSLFQLAISGSVEWQKCLALVLVGLLAAVGALCLACFAKVFGITFLGRPRSDLVTHAHEASPLMLSASAILVVLCVVLGFVVQQVMASISPIVQQVLVRNYSVEHFFNMPLTILTVMGLFIGWLLAVLVLKSGRGLRYYITWDCGFGALPSRTEETGTSFSQPIGRIFGSLLQYKVETEITGKDRRHFPDSITFDISMSSILEKRFYKPILGLFEELSRRMLALQTGSIHIYLLYVFLTLLILVGIGTRL